MRACIALLLLGCLAVAGRAEAPKSVIGAVIARRVSMVALARQLDILRPFIPAGIQSTFVLPNMNAMLIKADSQAALDQFTKFLQLLDQPVRQIMVEVELVQMNAADAASLGASWEVAGPPVSVTSNNGGGSSGNTSFRYARGNFRAGVTATIAASKAKLITAPKVLVQDGNPASILVSDPDNGTRMLQLDRVSVSGKSDVTVQLAPIALAPGVQAMVPVVRTRNGETILLGAIGGNTTTTDKTQPPLINVVPVVGGLAGSTNTSTSTPIAAIFLTTTILEPTPKSVDDFKAFAPPAPLWGG
jgi:type II secretory pathway component GspD/PulD (secretin)